MKHGVPPVRRIRRTLRSPRFVAWLLGALGLYLVVGSIIPQRSLDAAAVTRWAGRYPALGATFEALGLHEAFSHPMFLGMLFVLTASTVVCAWDRTARAARIMRSRGTVDARQVEALRTRPGARFEFDADDAEARYRDAGDALRRIGLRVRSGPLISEASSGAWGLLGSPIFHWAIVGLLLVVPVGALTRSEGLIGIVAGYEKPDVVESYGRLERGALHASMSGLTIGVEKDMPVEFIEDGIDRGAAPVVYLRDGDRELARGRVYPNKPLHHGALTVHISDWGLGAVTTLLEGDIASEPSQVLIDRDETSASGWASVTETYADPTGAEVASATFAPEFGANVAVRVEVARRDGSTISRVMGVGDAVDLADGVSLRIDHLGKYARLSVVDDWSISLLYALLVVACLSVGVSVLVPYRAAWVLLDRSGDVPALCVSVSHSRGDSGFVERVMVGVGAAVGKEDS